MSRKEYDFEGAEQGAVTKPPSGKTRITIRIDTDVLEWFRQQVHDAGGGNYQTLINDALRRFIGKTDRPVDAKTLRKILREELRSS